MPAEPAAPLPPARPFRPATPVVIGLLGGVAAGKSTVANCFARHGLTHLDADAVARQVTAEPPVLAALAAAFGPAVLAGGQLDRAALAKVVFADPAQRARLEAILHPPIRARLLAALAAERAAGRSVLLDVPLLLENGWREHCTALVFVEAPAEVRRQRAAQRGWSPGELERREAAQTPLQVKRAAAGHTIDNSQGLAATAAQVAALLVALAPDAAP